MVLFWLLRFGFSWTVSRDYKACFSSALLRGRREGPCKAPWLDFSPDLVVLRCKQDIKDRGDGGLMSLCVSVCIKGGCLCGFQALPSASSVAVSHTQLRRGTKTPVVRWWHTAHTHTQTENAQLKKTSVWFSQCGLDGVLQYFRPELGKKIPLVPPNKNNHFNYYGCAMVQPQRGWQDPAEVAPATGDGDEVWAGLQGNYRVVWRRTGGSWSLPPLPAVSPESYCLQLASSSLFHLRPLEIIGDVLRVNMFFVSKLSFIVSVRRSVHLPSMQKESKFFHCYLHSYASVLSLTSSAISCLPFSLFPPPSLHPSLPLLS